MVLVALLATGQNTYATQTPPPVPTCPSTYASLPMGTIAGNGQPRALGTPTSFLLRCYYARDGVGGVIIEVIWEEAQTNTGIQCATPEHRTSQLAREVYVYSQTKAAYLHVSVTPGRDINVYPATVEELLVTGSAMLSSVEARSVPCPGVARTSPAPAPTTVPAAQGSQSNAPAATAEPSSNTVGSDDLYREDGDLVGEDGLASAVLEPGTGLPSAEEAAIAGVAVVGVSTALTGLAASGTQAAQASGSQTRSSGRRRRRRPGDGILPTPEEYLRGRADAMVNRHVDRLIAKTGLGDPAISFIGGKDKIIGDLKKFARNPGAALGDFFKDAGRNLRNPARLGRHVLNGVKRVVDDSPVGLVARGIRSLFRRRPRAPRTAGPPTRATNGSQTSPDRPCPTSW
jgi:hypothetical protein